MTDTALTPDSMDLTPIVRDLESGAVERSPEGDHDVGGQQILAMAGFGFFWVIGWIILLGWFMVTIVS